MHILLVDPSRTVLKCLAGMLESQGHTVHGFADSAEALRYFMENPLIDVLITSAQLAPMSGHELCLEVRRIASCRRPIYILLMSSTGEHRNLIQALDSGADDFISKPPVTEELYARLRVASRILSMQRELVGQATIDFLTGFLNRRAFFEKAQEFCARAQANGSGCTIMFDIDHFKQINDTYGHGGGDETLRAIAREVSKDALIVGRLGGEEFAVLIEGQSVANAAVIAENLRQRLEKLHISVGQKIISITCSFGVSYWQSNDTIDCLLERADRALYRAKSNGRNRVVVGEINLEVPGYDRSTSAIRSGGRGQQVAA